MDDLLCDGGPCGVKSSKEVEDEVFVVCGSWDSFDTRAKIWDENDDRGGGGEALGPCKKYGLGGGGGGVKGVRG